MKGEVPPKGRQVRGRSPGQKEWRGGWKALGCLQLGRTGVGLTYQRPPLGLIWAQRLGAHLASEPPRRLQLFLEHLLHAGCRGSSGPTPPPSAGSPCTRHAVSTAGALRRTNTPPRNKKQKPGRKPGECLQALSLAAPRSPARLQQASAYIFWEVPGGTRPALCKNLNRLCRNRSTPPRVTRKQTHAHQTSRVDAEV